MEAEKHEHAKEYKIHVNGVDKHVGDETLTFEDVVALAFTPPDPNNIYLVSFEKEKEPKEGELLAGQSVEIKNGTEFDVHDTGRS